MYEDIPRGQLSTIILDCLKDKDKYGYEIIDEILKNSNGKLSIKQPSLYSSLKRMEDQSLISSYWRESDIGGKRHYYHLTDLGKKYLEKWQVSTNTNKPEEKQEVKVLQQENLFNINKITDDNNSSAIKAENKESIQNDSFVQYDLFSNNKVITAPSQEVDNVETSIINNANSNNNPQNEQMVAENNVEEQARITRFEYVKKTNKSFSDSSASVNTFQEHKYIDNNQKASFEDNSFDENKSNDILEFDEKNNKLQDNIVSDSPNEQKINAANSISLESIIDDKDNSISDDFVEQKTEMEDEEVVDSNQEDAKSQEINEKDDGVFITERIETPPSQNLWQNKSYSFTVDTNRERFIKENSEADTRLYDLYEKSKSNQEENIIKNNIGYYTYADLMELYSSQKIKFSVYKKALKKANGSLDIVKISKLRLFTNLILFGMYSLISLLFGIIVGVADKSAYLLSPFTFILYPLVLGIITLISFIDYKRYPKKMSEKNSLAKYSSFVCLMTLTVIPIIIAINLLFGFSFTNLHLYIITILYPILMSFTYFLFFIIRKLLLKAKIMY